MISLPLFLKDTKTPAPPHLPREAALWQGFDLLQDIKSMPQAEWNIQQKKHHTAAVRRGSSGTAYPTCRGAMLCLSDTAEKDHIADKKLLLVANNLHAV